MQDAQIDVRPASAFVGPVCVSDVSPHEVPLELEVTPDEFFVYIQLSDPPRFRLGTSVMVIRDRSDYPNEQRLAKRSFSLPDRAWFAHGRLRAMILIADAYRHHRSSQHSLGAEWRFVLMSGLGDREPAD